MQPTPFQAPGSEDLPPPHAEALLLDAAALDLGYEGAFPFFMTEPDRAED